MFKRYVMRIVAPILLLAGCGEMYSPGEDTADASLQRYTVEVRVANRNTETVRFAVSDKEKFSLDELKQTVTAKAGTRYSVTKIIQ
ncbi:hypothetical protein EBS67_17460 [bacterium]|nr:hypothetical protein [bacterium]